MSNRDIRTVKWGECVTYRRARRLYELFPRHLHYLSNELHGTRKFFIVRSTSKFKLEGFYKVFFAPVGGIVTASDGMFVRFDRWRTFVTGRYLNIEQTLWFFNVHFKSDPVMPGCLGLDAMWQLLGFYLCWLELPGYGRALGSDKVKFFGQVTPSAKLVRYEIDIKRVVNRGDVVGFADGNMFVDDRHVYSADGLKVGLFKYTSKF